MMAHGELCVTMDSLTLQPELFAILSDLVMSVGLSVAFMVPVAVPFGWTTFVATARNHTSQNVDTMAGVVTTVHTVTLFPSPVSLTRLKQLLSLEEEVHGLDVLKYSMLISGEPFVIKDLLTRQQESSATHLGLDISVERWTSTSMVWETV